MLIPDQNLHVETSEQISIGECYAENKALRLGCNPSYTDRIVSRPKKSV